jgi:4,5-DOPA dioxygenase extradiol
MDFPPTIHDFGGFPRALHEYSYPAPGSPAFAAEVARLLAPSDVGLDVRWGLDHGTWSVLTHLYPRADIPVVQLSIDADAEPQFHYDVGTRLARLRDEGVLIIGTGNVVHNLAAMRGGGPTSDDWAARFETRIRALVEAGDIAALAHLPAGDRDAARAIPTPEHYLPLLYVLGTRNPDDAVTFPTSGIVLDAISMLSVRIG